ATISPFTTLFRSDSVLRELHGRLSAGGADPVSEGRRGIWGWHRPHGHRCGAPSNAITGLSGSAPVRPHRSGARAPACAGRSHRRCRLVGHALDASVDALSDTRGDVRTPGN